MTECARSSALLTNLSHRAKELAENVHVHLVSIFLFEIARLPAQHHRPSRYQTCCGDLEENPQQIDRVAKDENLLCTLFLPSRLLSLRGKVLSIQTFDNIY